ncbi:MAG: ArsC family reductase [Thiotrichaceae bacterium]
MNIMYGIKNCDTIKKARKWMEANHVEYDFHDYREQGVNPVQLRNWVGKLGWEVLLNKRSTTWRNLPDETKQNMDETLAIHVMEDQPTIIKRPVIETANELLVGFNEERYQQNFL